MASPIMERKESFRSPLLQRNVSLLSMASPIGEHAMTVIFVPKKSIKFCEIHIAVHRTLTRDAYSNEELDAVFN